MFSFINYHKKKYNQLQTQDIVKMLYQNHFGPGHFISDINTVLNYYKNELNCDNINQYENLYEHIGNGFVRVNIFPYNKLFKDNELINMFYKSSQFDFQNESLLNNFKAILNKIDNDGFLNNYNFKDVHHSQKYKLLYNPHYRVINEQFLTLPMRVKQLQNYIDSFPNFTIFALEGKCASGKTTITSQLKDVTIIDVDDFFLHKDLKTEKRLNEVGGNIDYELYEQCLKQIKPNSKITYKIFDCSSQQYKFKTVSIKNKVILSGVYSYHPKVRKYINKVCYLLVNENIQMERIKQRKLYDKFINEWIPLENKYFDSYDFIENADILI